MMHALPALACLLWIFGPAASAHAFNSEEHKLVVDMGVADVAIDTSIVHLPPNTGFVLQPISSVLARYQSAKELAVGFQTNNQGEYDKYKRHVQDNAYWLSYAQVTGNKNLWIPPASDLRERSLVVTGVTTGVHSFTMGDLAAIYGDYRRTVHCVNGNCDLLEADATAHYSGGGLGFSRGIDCYPTPLQCGYEPAPMPMDGYLRAIAAGVWPPYGSLGNETSNSSYEDEYGDASWWGDDMIRIANVNDWHFSSAAVAWYVGMHRLALLSVQQALTNPAYWNHALHYEADALHSLTDLFCFGHIVTNRDETSYGINVDKGLTGVVAYQWMQNALTRGGARRVNGRIELGGLPAIVDAPNNRNDFMGSYRGTWLARAKTEHDDHDEFNNRGAVVRNLRGDTLTIFGDAKMRYMTASDVAIIAGAVRASVQALFDAAGQIKAGTTVEQIGAAGSPYFAALKYLPIFVVDDGAHFHGQWMRFAKFADDVSGAGVVPGSWDTCEMAYVSGSTDLPERPATPCDIFPVIASKTPGQAVLSIEKMQPSPFDQSCTVSFTLQTAVPVRATVHNIMGGRVATLFDGNQSAGQHTLTWDGRDASGRLMPAGVYLLDIAVGSDVASRKMVLRR